MGLAIPNSATILGCFSDGVGARAWFRCLLRPAMVSIHACGGVHSSLRWVSTQAFGGVHSSKRCPLTLAVVSIRAFSVRSGLRQCPLKPVVSTQPFSGAYSGLRRCPVAPINPPAVSAQAPSGVQATYPSVSFGGVRASLRWSPDSGLDCGGVNSSLRCSVGVNPAKWPCPTRPPVGCGGSHWPSVAFGVIHWVESEMRSIGSPFSPCR